MKGSFLMKRRILPGIVLAVMCVLSACNKAEPVTGAPVPTATTTTATTTAAVTTTAATTTAATTTAEAETFDGIAAYANLAIQEYSGVMMIEVIDLGTDYETLPAGMSEMNQAIYDDVVSRIESFGETYDENETGAYLQGLDIWAFSMSDENYIQIYNTMLEYPSYGTAGELFGFVYDVKNDDYVTLDEFLSSEGLKADEVIENIEAVYTDYYPEDTVEEINLKAFIKIDDEGEYYNAILLEMTVIPEGADEPYQAFYAYSPDDNDITDIDRVELFDPEVMDVFETPLHCQDGWEDMFGDAGESDGDLADEYSLLQGDYYFDGDTAAAHFSFYASENAESYYGSGSYEASYTIEYTDSWEVEDESGDTYNEVYFNVYDQSGEFVFIIEILDAAPGSFELYDADGELVGTYINIGI
jgi:hypothetical protein